MDKEKMLIVSFTEDEKGLVRTFDNTGFSPVELLGLLEYAKSYVLETGFGEPFEVDNENKNQEV